MIGRTIGNYEIVGKLGEGGMGEVYRARDRRLGRDVALKVLPERLAADLDRLARFEREARVVAALDHPHIATIHGIEEDGGRRFLVLECVEGETLAERLTRGPLPLEEFLRFGIQLASGLEAAHAAAVIHRDLKPGNLKITPQGKLKILDFGLAKIAPELGASDLAHSPTLSYAATEAGMLLGTVAYMSPQQATGRPLDKRTDVWAFGCVLYECLTGRRAFDGETTSDVIAAVLKQEPDWGALPAETPPSLRRLLQRCLAKDPERRLHDVADARLELEELEREPSSPIARTAAVDRSRRPTFFGWALAAILAVLAVGWALSAWRSASSGSAAATLVRARFDLRPPPGIAIELSTASATLAISPDGRLVAFRGRSAAGSSQLYLRSIDELEARPIPGSEDGSNPFFSPDGRSLAFVSRQALRRVPLAGGEPRPICDTPRLRGASWGEDDTIVFSDGVGLLRVSAGGGTPEPLTNPASDAGLLHYWPHHLPGGQGILFQILHGVEELEHEIVVLPQAGGEPRTLVRGGSYPRYANGQLIFGRLGSLYAASFDPARLALVGEPRQVLDDVYYYQGSNFFAYDLARNGELVFTPGAPRVRDAELVQFDRRGQVSSLAERRAAYDGVAFSPDGKRLAVLVDSSLVEADIWVYDFGGQQWSRLTFSNKAIGSNQPVWSPHGKWVYFSMVFRGIPKVFRARPDGGSPPEQITEGVLWDHANAISPDGRTLLFQRQMAAAQWDLYTLEPDGDRTPRPFSTSPVLEAWGDFSPDGRWVVYEADDSGRREIYARAYPSADAKVTISTEGGWVPKWSPRGDEILFRCGPGSPPSICSVPVRLGDRLTVGRPQRLFEARVAPRAWLGRFSLSPDGSALAMVRRPPEADVERRLHYAPRWLDELTGR